MSKTDDIELEIYENEIEDPDQSYIQLAQILQERIKKEDIDIMVLVTDAQIPDNISQNISNGIRLHLEEKSQRSKVKGARFFYAPYELFRVGDSNISVK